MVNYMLVQRWSRVVILYEDDEYGSGLHNSFIVLAKSHGIKVIASFAVSVDVKDQDQDADALIARVQDLDDPRIFLFLGTINRIYSVLKAASKSNLYGPGKVWMASEASSQIQATFADAESRSLFTGLIVFLPMEGEGVANQKFKKLWQDKRLSTAFPFANRTSPDAPGTYSYFAASCLELLIKG